MLVICITGPQRVLRPLSTHGVMTGEISAPKSTQVSSDLGAAKLGREGDGGG